MNSIKVAHIATIDMGLRYLLLNQLVEMRRIGYKVYGISSPGPDVEAIEAAGVCHIPVKVNRRPLTPIQDLRTLFELYRVCRREGFTIVHTHNPKPGVLGQIAARMAGVPVVVNTVHGFYFHDRMRPILRQFYIVMEKIAARCSDLIFSQNREDIETAVREGVCEPSKIKFLGNGIDVRRFDPDALGQDAVLRTRADIGLSAEDRVVGFVGRLVRSKGLLELFAASRLVRQRVPNVRFLFVGPVDTHKADAVTPETALEYGLGEVGRFLGMRQDLPELYSVMDVFVLPSHREGFPRAPMEASAMKVPCVVTDIRGCREVVEDGRNGFLIPLGDVQALAGAICDLLCDPDKARLMGVEGRRIALERFSERVVFDKIKTEYARLLEEKGLLAPVLA